MNPFFRQLMWGVCVIGLVGCATSSDEKTRAAARTTSDNAFKETGYVCSLESFMKTFEGKGATEADARSAALAACKSRYHEKQCDSMMSCKKI